MYDSWNSCCVETTKTDIPKLRFSRLSKTALKRRKIAQNRAPKIAKKKELCRFYTQHGRCHNYSKCPYIHDPKKVALCHAYLRGECKDDHCLLQHSNEKLAHRMPACYHFNRGNCLAERCIYAHVHVNGNAPICEDFKKGFCPRGPTCQLKHTLSKNEEKPVIKSTAQNNASELDAYSLYSAVKINPKLRSRITPRFALKDHD